MYSAAIMNRNDLIILLSTVLIVGGSVLGIRYHSSQITKANNLKAEQAHCDAQNAEQQARADAIGKATNGTQHGAQTGTCIIYQP